MGPCMNTAAPKYMKYVFNASPTVHLAARNYWPAITISRLSHACQAMRDTLFLFACLPVRLAIASYPNALTRTFALAATPLES